MSRTSTCCTSKLIRSIFGSHYRGPCTSLRTAWPFCPTVLSKQRPKPHQDREQHCQNGPRGNERRLGSAVAPGGMSQIEERWATLRTRIHDFKDRLQVAVQVDQGLGEALEEKRLIPSVPPAVRHAARKAKLVTGLKFDLPTTNRRRDSSRNDPTSLILFEVDVERRPFAVGRETAVQLEPWTLIILEPSKLEPLTGVSVFEHQRTWGFFAHGDAASILKMPNVSAILLRG